MSTKTHSQDLVSKIYKWIDEVLSVPNPVFNNLPACPYAKQAWKDNKVIVKEHASWVDAYSDVVTRSYDFTKYDVIIFAFPRESITPQQLSQAVENLNTTWPNDHAVILEDHPDELETVKGFRLNFGECCLLFVQSCGKLKTARADLESKGYYKHWSKEYKQDVQHIR